jgi:hypothetical protein
MDSREIVWEGVDWIHLGSCEHSNECLSSIKGREFVD